MLHHSKHRGYHVELLDSVPFVLLLESHWYENQGMLEVHVLIISLATNKCSNVF